jgi:uncharacterized protein YjbI with pentapeptide repeats
MANPEHLAVLKQGVALWNRWRQEHPQLAPQLDGADLRRATLEGADFRRASLTGVRLDEANLTGARIRKANLSEAGLGGAVLKYADFTRAFLHGTSFVLANLSDADLSGAHLEDADLSWAKLIRTDLRSADLSGAKLGVADLNDASLCRARLGRADFTGARAGGTQFDNTDLSLAVGLETVLHRGPSSIGIDTIYKSKGTIPEKFLRGCGVPEEFIAYIGSMVGRPIEYYSCFISYSTKDQGFADRLYADLQAKGVRCWFAPHDIMGGRKIHEQIDEAIRVHDKLLLILSEHSMASDWVGTEIANAREREAREKKQMLFPITIAPFEEVKQWKKFDADLGSDSAKAVREYYIPDFSGWDSDHAGYQREFERLVAALKSVVSG